MKQKNKRHILGRYVTVTALIIIVTIAVVFKLAQTTIIDADKWNVKGDMGLDKVISTIPERGKILSDDGMVLATNLYFYTARIDWTTKGIKTETFRDSLPKLCDSLEVFCNGKKSAKEWEKELSQKMSEKRSRSYRLFSDLSHKEFMRLKTFPFFNMRKNKCGFYYEITMKRAKPYGSMASRSIGLVTFDKGTTPHGRSGLEMALDSLLYGVPGWKTKKQLNSGIVNWEEIAAKKGYDIKTTINIDLQDIVENELYQMCNDQEAEWGTAVLMEVKTGEIKAISNLEWNKNANDYIEGCNNAVLGYEPGSVMKTISMMIALEDGIVSNIDSVIVTGKTFAYAGGRPISDSHGAASMPVRQVIASSSNIGMAKIILRKYEKDPGTFYDRLKGMGFFEPLNTGIFGETTPFIQRLGTKNWDRIGLTRIAYGYSTRIPPMCTLAMYNAIANDGKYVRPHLVKELLRDGEVDSIVPISYIRPQVCSPLNAQKLRTMLHDVVWSEHGTAKVLQNDYVEIAGKTGTCYVIEKGAYSSSKRYAFCGFFPFKNPKYSCIVVIHKGRQGAARSSGTVLKNIALKLYARGLLDNHSDYRESSNVAQASRSTFFATPRQGQNDLVAQELGINPKHWKKGKNYSKNEVPSVIGYSIRDAITTLESVGLTVRFTGSGCVTSQSIAAGTHFNKGQIINLTLRH